MIKDSEVFKIGKLIKPHGIKGEISFAFESDIFDRVDCPYLICRIDGIFVPFFVDEYRFKGSETALITFEGVDSEDKAMQMSGLEVFFLRKYFEEESDDDIDYSWNFFIGFSVVDKVAGNLGTIEEIDDKTINTLFLVKNDDEDLIIPATEDFVEKIDAKKRILYLNLPEGLV